MKNGPYELVRAPEGYPGKKYRGKYAYEHRVNYWREHGELPPAGHLVHHENERKRDNDPQNLVALTPKEHARKHAPMIEISCSLCGASILFSGALLRSRLKRNGGNVFCTRRCGAMYQHGHRLKQRPLGQGDQRLL